MSELETQNQLSSSSKTADSQGNQYDQDNKLLSQKSSRNGRISKQERRASRLKQGKRLNNLSFIKIRNFDEDNAYLDDQIKEEIQNSDQVIRKKYCENEYKEQNQNYRMIDNDDEVEQTEQSRISQSENILFTEEQQALNIKNDFNSRNQISNFFANNHTSEFNKNKSKDYFSNDGENSEIQKLDAQNYYSNSRLNYYSSGQLIESEQLQSDKFDEKMSVIQELSMQSSTLAISKPASNSKKNEFNNNDSNQQINRQSLGHYSRREEEDDEDEPSLQSPNIQKVKSQMKSTDSTVIKNFMSQLLQDFDGNESLKILQQKEEEEVKETQNIQQQFSQDLEQRDHLSESPRLPQNRNINRREQHMTMQEINNSYSTHNVQQQKQLQYNIESGKKVVRSGSGYKQLGLRLTQNQTDYQPNLSEKKKIFEGNINMNVKVMEYDRLKIDEQSPNIRDFNGQIEPNSPTANFIFQDEKLQNPEANTPIRINGQDFEQNNLAMTYRSKSQNNISARSGNTPFRNMSHLPSIEVQAHIMQNRQNSILLQQQVKNLSQYSPFDGKRNCLLNQSQPHFESLYNQKFQMNNTNLNPLLSPFQGKCLSQHDSIVFQNEVQNPVLGQSRLGMLNGSEMNQLCQSYNNLQFNKINQNSSIQQQIQYSISQPMLRGDSQLLKTSQNHNLFDFDTQSQANNNSAMNHGHQQTGEQYEVLLRERGDFIEKISQQQKNIENLKKEIKKNIVDLQNQTFTISELKQDIEEHQQNMKSKDNVISDLKETMKRQNEQINELREDLNNSQQNKSFAAFEILKKKNQELILQNQKLMKEIGENDYTKKNSTVLSEALNNTQVSNFSNQQNNNFEQVIQTKQKEIYTLTVELGMIREENNELKKNIQIHKEDFQLRLKEQKERYEDDYNKLLEKNLNFDFYNNQKQINDEDLQSKLEKLQNEISKLKQEKNQELEEIQNELNQKIEENKQMQKLGHLQKLEINQLTYNYKMLSQQLDDLHKQINSNSKLQYVESQQMKIQQNSSDQDINDEHQASMSKTFEYEICEAPNFKSDYAFDFNNQLKNSPSNMLDSRIQNNREILSKISFRNNEDDSIAQDKFCESSIQQIQFFKHENIDKDTFKSKYLNETNGREDEQTLSENIQENINEIEHNVNRTSFQAKLKIESSPQKIVLTTCNEEDDIDGEKLDSLSQFEDQERLVSNQINCNEYFTHNPAEKDKSANIETYQQSIIDIQDKQQEIDLQQSQENIYLQNLIQYENDQYENEDRCMLPRSSSELKQYNDKKQAYQTFLLQKETQGNTIKKTQINQQKDRPCLNQLNTSIEQQYQQIFTPENKSVNRVSKISRMMSARSPIQVIRNNTGKSLNTGSSSRVLYNGRKSITNDFNTKNNTSQCDINSNLQSVKQSGKLFNQVVSQVKNSMQKDGVQSSLSFINSQRMYEPIETGCDGQKSMRDFQINATTGHSSKQSLSIGSKLLSQRRKFNGKSAIPQQLEKSQSSVQIKNNFQKHSQRQVNQNLSITSRDLNTKMFSNNHLNKNQSHSELPMTVVQTSKHSLNQKLLQSKQKQLDIQYKSRSFFGETAQSIQKQQYASCKSSINLITSNKQLNNSQLQTQTSQNTLACTINNPTLQKSQYVVAMPEKKQKMISGTRPSMFICQVSQTKQGLTPVIQESSFNYKNQTSGYATYEQLQNPHSGNSSQYNSNNISARKNNKHNFNKNLSPQMNIKQSSNSKNLSSSKQMLLNQIEELGETMIKKKQEEKGDHTDRHQIQKYKASSKTTSFLQNSQNQFTRPCATQRGYNEDGCISQQKKSVREELENTTSSMVLKEGLIRMASNQRLSLRYNQPLCDTMQYEFADSQPFQSEQNKNLNRLNQTVSQTDKIQSMSQLRLSKIAQSQVQNDKKQDSKEEIKKNVNDLIQLQNTFRQVDSNEIVSPDIFRQSVIGSSCSGLNAGTLKDLQKKEKLYQSGKAYLEKKIQEYESRLNQMKAKKEKAARSKVNKEQM